MKTGISFLLILLLAMSVVSLGVIGCGGDEEEKKETTTKPTTPATEPADDEVASKPIDFAAEKAALQKVWSDFVTGFNTFEVKNVEPYWAKRPSDQFHVIFADKEQSGWESWANISKGMKGLWEGIGTKGKRWAAGSGLTTFYIRKTEASANGATGYDSAGRTYVYFMKINDEWKISLVDSITTNNLAFRKAPIIPRYFEDEKDKAP